MATSARGALIAELRDGVARVERTLDDLAGRATVAIGGGWSAKDVLAHHLMWLDASLQSLGVRGEDHPWLGQDAENDRAVERARDVPLAELRHRLRVDVDALIGALGSLDDAALTTPGFVDYAPRLTRAEAIRKNTVPHWDQHDREIRAWAGLP